MGRPLRHLVLVLGDQLDPTAAVFDDFDPAQDAIWMAEVAEESTHVWSSKPRIALFLSAMRHFRDAQHALGRQVRYRALDEPGNTNTLAGELSQTISAERPAKLVMTEPGDWRVQQALTEAARDAKVPLEIRTDRHFLSTIDQFRAHAKGRKQLRLEFWYRELRREHQVLLDASGGPEGGEWNYDAENRGAFGKPGPGLLPAPIRFTPDPITREVIALVEARFASHPGRLDAFDWPVTPADASAALDDFITHRLAVFGQYQDAMWTREPWLYHSRIAAALNLKLLDPRLAIAAAEQAYRTGCVPLASAEGFIRQILGWREFIRGTYFHEMPALKQANHYGHERPLPRWYWSGDTRMACMREAVGQTLAHGYAHHIQRLMVTGQFALLAGIRPQAVCDWYLAAYVDAVEWVELPNTAGMALFANGGRFTSKPYVASGQYIKRMSNYCQGCAYRPEQRTGDTACPVTTLYWAFLDRHEATLAKNPRTILMAKSVARLGDAERESVRRHAAYLLDRLDHL